MSELNAYVASPNLKSEELVKRQAILYDALSPKKLDLTILPTEKCNFRCVYCYEDFAVGRMNQDTITGVKNLISSRAPDLDFLRIAWFGGEPFIAYDIVLEILEHASEVARRYGIDFSSSATTNGYTLNRDRLLQLDGVGVRKYQISLDGDEEGHNKTRLRIDGAGTFNRVWRCVETFNELYNQGRLRESSIILRIHVHPGNIESVQRLSERIKSSLNPGAFTIHIENIGHYGGPNDKVFEVFNPADPAWHAIYNSLYAALSDYQREIDDETYVCYASKANHFIIRADGGVGKCTLALKSRSNAVGRLHLDGTMELMPTRLEPWLHGLRSMNKDDLACPAANLPKMIEAQ